MVTLADSLVSSASRKLTLRMRPDLTWRRHHYLKHPYIVVKEPVGLKYFRFQEEEFAILEMLNGQVSLEDIKERFEAEFAPEKITLSDLQNFIGMLHRSGLVISDATGQGKQLARRSRAQKWKKFVGAMSNVLAVRFRGIDPDRVLNWMYPYTKWVFHPGVVGAFLVMALGALLLIGINFDVFVSKLPAFHEFFGATNWLPLALTLMLVKIIHEFGHGLSCKHYGGECHEMGFMLLVLTPCLYCNVSDSWMLRNKWHRMVIGGAGIYIEVMLAALATYVWWFSVPGLLNHLALRVMFICSVSTVLFNGNPLLRFDGYYILADYLEIPNLRQKATEVLKRFLTELCLGIEQPEDPFLPQNRRFWFGMYTVAAVIYRWVVLLSILLFLNQVLEPYGLKIIGQFIALTAIVGLFIQPSVQIFKFFHIPGRMHQVKKHRLATTLAVVAAVVLGVLYLPFPHYVRCSFELEPQNAASVFVDVPGKMKELRVKPGEYVQAGQTLAVLENPDLAMDVIAQRGLRETSQVRLDNAWSQRYVDLASTGGRDIPELKESLSTNEKLLAEKEEKVSRLVIKAPVSGHVIPPRERPESPRPDRLPTWSGTPFMEKNENAFFNSSDLLCMIGDPKRMEAVMVIDQADIDLISDARVAVHLTDLQTVARQRGEKLDLKSDASPEEQFFQLCDIDQDGSIGRDEAPKQIARRVFRADANDNGEITHAEWKEATVGDEVYLKLDGFPFETYTSDVKEISQRDLADTPDSLTNQAGGDIATKTDPRTGVQRPLNTSYQARAPLELDTELLRPGLRGRAKVYTGWQPLGKRIWRFITRTFHFEL